MIDRRAHDGRQLGIQIRLDPLGAFSLFGVPLHELGNRFALLGRLLTDRIAAGPMPSPELAWAWRTMRDAGGPRAIRCGPLTASQRSWAASINLNQLERHRQPGGA
jgi:hypothetical protein